MNPYPPNLDPVGPDLFSPGTMNVLFVLIGLAVLIYAIRAILRLFA